MESPAPTASISKAYYPSKSELDAAYDKYVHKRVRLKDIPAGNNGKAFEGKVFGVDPQPKPNIDGQHFTPGTWLVIALDPPAGKIPTTVYRLPEQVQVL